MTFSIITPSFRSSEWLKLCVASVADQGVAAEHIVQDADSDDGTIDWLKNDSRVRLFVEKDRGMYDAINRGLRRASGELLAYLNCDEQYLPGALKTVEEYFAAHPDVDIVFGDIVMVDGDGEYLCHRKTQPPRLYHTWVCHLSTLTCATFFRRRLIEPGGFFFNSVYRCGGDGEWMVRLLRSHVRMGALRQFTSVFARTGSNLSRAALAREEEQRLRRTAPVIVRALAPLWVGHHRLRRWLDGSYTQPPFNFSLFTKKNPQERVVRQAAHPTFRCPGW